jgi:hypothetical protein
MGEPGPERALVELREYQEPGHASQRRHLQAEERVLEEEPDVAGDLIVA